MTPAAIRQREQAAGIWQRKVRQYSDSENALRKREARAAAYQAEVDADIPEEVFARGKILTAMMRLPTDQWKPEWLSP